MAFSADELHDPSVRCADTSPRKAWGGKRMCSRVTAGTNGVGGMALDPESQRLIDLMAAANRPAWNTLSPQAARDLYLSLRPASQGPRPAEAKVVDRTIPGPAGDLAVRIYRPASAPGRRQAAVPGLRPWRRLGVRQSRQPRRALRPVRAGSGHRGLRHRLPAGAGSALPRRLRRRRGRPEVGGGQRRLDRRRSDAARHRRRQRRRQSRRGRGDLGARQWRTQAAPATSRLSGDRRRGPRRVLSPLRGRLRAECRHHGMVLRSLHAGQGEPRRLARLAAARQVARLACRPRW